MKLIEVGIDLISATAVHYCYRDFRECKTSWDAHISKDIVLNCVREIEMVNLTLPVHSVWKNLLELPLLPREEDGRSEEDCRLMGCPNHVRDRAVNPTQEVHTRRKVRDQGL